MSLYYIQNLLPVGNCVSWWAEGGHGYTCELDHAGKYSEEEAANIVRNRPDIDKAWRCEDVDGVAARHVDFQRLREFQALAAHSRPYEVGLHERLKDPAHAAAYLEAASGDSEGLALAREDVAGALQTGAAK